MATGGVVVVVTMRMGHRVPVTGKEHLARHQTGESEPCPTIKAAPTSSAILTHLGED